MKGNVYSAWLREFCALVFVQTVQAFTLAIILVMIATTFEDGAVDNSIKMNAAGILSVIALASISKIEELIKTLFGLNSQITDTSMKGGQGGLMQAVVLGKMLKRLGDNIPKLVKGAAQTTSSNMEIRKLKKNRKADLMQAQLDSKPTPTGATESSDSETSTSSGGGRNVHTNQVLTAGAAATAGAVAAGAVATGAVGNIGSISVDRLEVRTANVTNSNTKNKTGDKAKDFEKERKRIEDDYREKLRAQRDKRRAGMKQMASSVVETGLAVQGATIGAVAAAGTGSKITSGMQSGAIVGDVLGQTAVNIVSDVAEAGIQLGRYSQDVRDINKRIKELDKKLNAGDL